MLSTSIASLLVDFKTISLIKTFQLNYMNRFIRRTSTLQELIWLHPSCSLSLSPLFHRPFFLHNFLLFTHNPSYLWLFLPPLLLPLLPLFFIIIFMFFVFFQFFALFLFLRILFLTSYLFSLPLLFRLLFLLLSVVFSSSSCLFAFFYLPFVLFVVLLIVLFLFIFHSTWMDFPHQVTRYCSIVLSGARTNNNLWVVLVSLK